MSFFGVGCTVNHIAHGAAKTSLRVGTAECSEEMMGRPGRTRREERREGPRAMTQYDPQLDRPAPNEPELTPSRTSRPRMIYATV